MLEKLQELARRYMGARPWMLVLALLSLCSAVWILMTSDRQAEDVGLIPAMLLFAWATMFHSFLNLFACVPPQAVAEENFGKRLTAIFKRGAYYMFAFLMALVTLLLVVTTLQMLGAWRTMY